MAFPGFQTRDRTRGLVGLNTSAKNTTEKPISSSASLYSGNLLHEWYVDRSSQKGGAWLSNQGFWVGALQGATGYCYTGITASLNSSAGLYVKVANGSTGTISLADGYGWSFSHTAGNAGNGSYSGGYFTVPNLCGFQFNNAANNTAELRLKQNSTNALEINNGTAGTFRDVKLRNLIGTGNLTTGLAAKTADYTSTPDDGTLTFDASGAPRTNTLETAVGANGRIKVIVKIDSSANTVTIDPNASETINGAATLVLSAQWDKAIIQSDGANWIRIA